MCWRLTERNTPDVYIAAPFINCFKSLVYGTLKARSTVGRRLRRRLANSTARITSPAGLVRPAVESRLNLVGGGRYFSFVGARGIFEIVFHVNRACPIQLFELSLRLCAGYHIIINIIIIRYTRYTPYRHRRGGATTCGFDFISENGSNGRIAYCNNFSLPMYNPMTKTS